MKTCVVAVFLKKTKKTEGMYVPGTAIDVCIVLTLMYYKFSITIVWGGKKTSYTRFSFEKLCKKKNMRI